jgi:tetraacyldisaccharide 4'-kinase
MLSTSDFYEIVSGRRRGLTALLWRGLLRVASWPYGLVMRWRNSRYDRDPRRVTKVSVPVISVGNLTLGGTGKTPCVEWLCRWFRQQGIRVSIISRGYGAEESSYNDEARELEEKLPDVPHIQNPDRIAAAELAIEELATQVIVLDDAFQHRRIARDLDLVLIDATAPDGFGAIFPRGTLREPLSGLRRAHGLILTRADQIITSEISALRERFLKLAPQAFWAVTTHAPQALRDAVGNETLVATLAGQTVAAFCGIGNPAAFQHTLEQAGAKVAELKSFADHYQYQRADIENLSNWAQELPVTMIVCTHKDLVKIGKQELGGKPLRALRIGLAFQAGEPELIAALQQIPTQIPTEEDESAAIPAE